MRSSVSDECGGNRSPACNTNASMCHFRQRRGGLLITPLSLTLTRTDEIRRTALIKVYSAFASSHFLNASFFYILDLITAFCVLCVHPHPHPHLEVGGVPVRREAIHNSNCSQDAGFNRRRSNPKFSLT